MKLQIKSLGAEIRANELAVTAPSRSFSLFPHQLPKPLSHTPRLAAKDRMTHMVFSGLLAA